jgi:hypothetical protein
MENVYVPSSLVMNKAIQRRSSAPYDIIITKKYLFCHVFFLEFFASMEIKSVDDDLLTFEK